MWKPIVLVAKNLLAVLKCRYQKMILIAYTFWYVQLFNRFLCNAVREKTKRYKHKLGFGFGALCYIITPAVRLIKRILAWAINRYRKFSFFNFYLLEDVNLTRVKIAILAPFLVT